MKAPAVFLVVLLAGCSTPVETAPFDGDGAYAFTEGLVDGPRFRVPGTPGHPSAADWLQEQMQVPGWTVARQHFTGADVKAADRSFVASYTREPYCNAEDEAALDDLDLWNLEAVLPAQPPTDLRMVLGAHWDSKAEASNDPDPDKRDEPVLGAGDGASGVGVLLQLMRHLEPMPFDVAIVFFDAEDGFEDCHPLAGSIHYVQALEPGEVDRMLLLDMVGDPEAVFPIEGRSEASDPELRRILWHHGQEVGDTRYSDDTRSVLDDHVPFIEAGIPAVDLIDYGRDTWFAPWWHTTDDTMEHVDADALGLVGQAVWDTLQDDDFLASFKPIPEATT